MILEHPSSFAARLESANAHTRLTPGTIYEIGRYLSVYSHTPGHHEIASAFDEFLLSCCFKHDDEWLLAVLEEVNHAFLTVLCGNYTDDDVMDAIESICGIYMSSKCACALIVRKSNTHFPDLVQALASAYNNQNNSDRITIKKKELVLTSVTNLLEHALLTHKEENDDILVVFQRLLMLCMNHNTNTTCCLLGDLSRSRIKGTLKQVFAEDETQREYIMQILESCPHTPVSQAQVAKDDDDPKKIIEKKTVSVSPVAPTSKYKEVAVDQVKSIFPDLGEGYIEAALACYKGDVSQTISALLEDDRLSLHPQLELMDRKLGPRNRKGDLYKDTEDADRADAISTQKERIKVMQKDEENKAFLLSTAMDYNDDYDDQFDGTDEGGGASGMVGSSDGALYDIDYNAIRTYNQVALDMEKEDNFWNEMRNSNRERKPHNPSPVTSLSQSQKSKGKPSQQKTKTNKGNNDSGKADSSKSNKSDNINQSKADVSKGDIRSSQARKRSQQKHNKARAMRKMGV